MNFVFRYFLDFYKKKNEINNADNVIKLKLAKLSGEGVGNSKIIHF